MRVRRLLLFVLVAMNLTLVCQGHAADGSHTGAHFALLGEPHIEEHAEHPTGEAAAQRHEPELNRAQERGHEVGTSWLPIEEAGRNSDPALLSGGHVSSVAILAVALLGTVGGAPGKFGLGMLSRVTWVSRTRQPPEPPPPRSNM